MNFRRFITLTSVAIVCGAAAACATAPIGFGETAGGDGGSNGPNGIDPGGDGSSSDPAATGLPCDIRNLMAAECTNCHGTSPSQSATTSLVTYEDLTKSSPTHPTQSEAAVCLARMQGGVPPMPPPPASASSASDISTLSNWIAAGTPRGTCDTSKPPTSPDGGPLPDAGDPYDTPTVCTSGQTWTLGDTKSTVMKPGSECQTCHTIGGSASGKEFDISGTVYPTAHEPDDCNGSATATVVITDSKGATTSLSVNSAGNFYHDDGFGFLKIATPYTASVTVGPKSRVMVTPQTDGNCNHCHTTAGTLSAPGRVMTP